LSHMVIFRTADGQPGYHQAEELMDAVSFVERLRNSEGVEQTRIFRMEEVEFDFKPYYKVEVPHGAPAPVIDTPVPDAAPAFEAQAPAAPAFETPAPAASSAFEPAPAVSSAFDPAPEVPAPAVDVPEAPMVDPAPVAPLGSPFSAAPADLTPEAPSWSSDPMPTVGEVPPPPPPPISVPDPIPEPALGVESGLGDAMPPPPPPPPEPIEAVEHEGDPVASGNGMSARRGLFGR
jgi:hypothetical protein